MDAKFYVNNYVLIWNLLFQASISEPIYNLKQKLKQIKPTSIGQALRISGVNPADISLLMVYIKKEYFYEQR